MPFAPAPTAATGDDNYKVIKLIGGRYDLIRCMADTALGKVFWACDKQQSAQKNDGCNHVLVLTVLPSLARNTIYEQALRQVLPNYREKHPTEPLISDDGKEADGTRWIVAQNIRGMLLAERLHELDDRGIPLNETISILQRLAEAVSHHRPNGIFGFLEPGAVLAEDNNSYCLLNSPLVAALRLANNGIIQRPDKLQTFHSGFISPEVAVGEAPQTADDTFSIACIGYNLLQGRAPFGQQSTLEAIVHHTMPHSLSKRKGKGNVWPALQKGLGLNRKERPPTPTSLLNNLQAPKRPALLFPAIAAGIAVVVAFAGYQILSGLRTSEESTTTTTIPAFEGNEPVTLTNEVAPAAADETTTQVDNEQQTAAEQAKTAEEAARIEAIKREAEAQVQAELAAADKTADTAQQQEITQLLKDAEQAAQDNNLINLDPTQPTATYYLAKVLKLDSENAEARQLLTQIVNKLHDQAETLISQQEQNKASKLLATSDKIIADFTLSDSLQRQVKLEIAAEKAGHEQDGQAHTEQYIERAKHAIDYGNLTEGDDRSDSAIAYLSALFDASPNNPDGIKLLKKIIGLQHKQAKAELRKNNTDKARALLDDSQKLIGEYTLDDQVEAQLDLEKRYRDVALMGISASEPDKTEEKQQTSHEEKAPRSETASSGTATVPAPLPPPLATNPASINPANNNALTRNNTGAMPDSTDGQINATTPFEQTGETATGQIPETMPVEEVPVPPDVPVTAAVPVVNDGILPDNNINLPVQLDPVPTDTSTVLPETASTESSYIPLLPDNNAPGAVEYIKPVNTSPGSASRVEGLAEYPLEEVEQGLPPVQNIPGQ